MTKFDDASEFWDIGYACVKEKEKWRLIDKTGRYVFERGYDDIGQLYGVEGGKGCSLAKRRWGTSKNGFSQRSLGEANICRFTLCFILLFANYFIQQNCKV